MPPFGAFDSHLFVVICSMVVPILLLLILIRLTRSNISESYEVSFTHDGKRRRPLSLAEAGFMSMGIRYGIVVSASTIESEVPLNPKMVNDALIMLSKRYPLLRMRVTKDSHSGKEYFSEMDEPNFVDFQVLQDANADDWIPVAEQQSLGWFDFASGPLWRAILLKEEYDADAKKYKNTLLIRNHHVISDGRSSVAFFEQFLEYLSLLYKGEEVVVESLPFRPPLLHLLRHCCTPSMWDVVFVRAVCFIMRLKTMLGLNTKPSNLYTAIFPPAILSNPSVPVVTSIVPRMLSAEDTKAFVQSCKEHNCTVHGAITAATHMAMAKILQGADNAVKSPLSLKTSLNVGMRKECRPKIELNEFGFFISFVAIESTVPISETEFWLFAEECTQKVHRAIGEGKHHRIWKLMSVSKFGSAESVGRRETIFNISNLGRFELGQGKQWPYRPVARYGFMAEHTMGPVFGNNLVTLNGKLIWGLVYFTNVTTKEQAELFIDLAIDIVKNATNTGKV